MPRLEYLDVSHCRLAHDTLVQAMDHSQLTPLKALDISWTDAHDDVLIAIAQAAHFNQHTPEV